MLPGREETHATHSLSPSCKYRKERQRENVSLYGITYITIVSYRSYWSTKWTDLMSINVNCQIAWFTLIYILVYYRSRKCHELWIETGTCAETRTLNRCTLKRTLKRIKQHHRLTRKHSQPVLNDFNEIWVSIYVYVCRSHRGVYKNPFSVPCYFYV